MKKNEIEKEIEVLGKTKEEDYTKPIKVVKKDTKAKKNEKNKKEEVESNNMSRRSKKRKLKKGIIQKTFNIISFLFILGCCIFYGLRMIKYYRIYNPKDEKMPDNLYGSILKKANIVTSGNGLYKVDGGYLYKGKDVKNYIKFGNLTWRIVRINEDQTIDIVLDENLNSLSYDASKLEYISSDINNYLNKVFIKHLNKDLLAKTTLCLNEVDKVQDFSCDKTNTDNYVRLLDASNYLNSFDKDNTYISDEDTLNNIWTSSYSNKGVWVIEENTLVESDADEAYYVKPVVTINKKTKLIKGNGSLEKPYEIEKKESVAIGDHVILGDDSYIVYDIDGDIVKLQTNNYKVLEKREFSNLQSDFDLSDYSNIAYYLNYSYYYTLSYKDILEKVTWETGRYNGKYSDISNATEEAYIGLLSVKDLKFNNDGNYYLSNAVSDNKVFYYSDSLDADPFTSSKGMRPAIAINKNNIKSGSGTESDPYRGGE